MKAKTARRLAWSLWAAGVAFLVADLILWLAPPPGYSLNRIFDPHIVLVPGYVTVGAVIASRRRENRMGWLFLALGLMSAETAFASLYAVHALSASPRWPGGAIAAWFANWQWSASFGLLFFLFLLFPDGRLPSRRWRPVAWATSFFVILFVLVGMFDGEPLQVGDITVDNPVGFLSREGSVAGAVSLLLVAGSVLGGLAIVASFIAPAIRRRRATPEEREQLRWLAWVLAVSVVSAILAIALAWTPVAGVFGVLAVVGVGFGVPVAVGIAVLKYRLYEIDTVIRRSVVFGLLAASVTAIYVGLVVGVGSLVGSVGNVPLSIVATAIIGVAFQPIRDRARRVADRLVYGKRATPYEVLSSFSERVASSIATEDILPTMARILAEGTGAVRAGVWLRVGNELRPAVTHPNGTDGHDPVRLAGDGLPTLDGADRAEPVTHRGELLGALTVTKRAGEALSPTEEKLMSDLAAQAGLVLRNVRLVEDLRASRQRIVTAQDERAKALERNLHDGAQQQLVALAVKQRLVAAMVLKDQEKAAAMLVQLQTETMEALDDLRDLARGIYPPLLADQGLLAALEARARKSPVPTFVEAEGIARYPQEAEAAVYFCCLEAVQNASKYAEGSRIVIRLSAEDGGLSFAVEDDGKGFDVGSAPVGAGTQNMADRLEALGGTLEVRSQPGQGTVVIGRLPVRPRA